MQVISKRLKCELMSHSACQWRMQDFLKGGSVVIYVRGKFGTLITDFRAFWREILCLTLAKVRQVPQAERGGSISLSSVHLHPKGSPFAERGHRYTSPVIVECCESN